MTSVVLFGQSGCAMIAGHLAVAGGKKVYHEIKEDRASHDHHETETVVVRNSG